MFVPPSCLVPGEPLKDCLSYQSFWRSCSANQGARQPHGAAFGAVDSGMGSPLLGSTHEPQMPSPRHDPDTAA